MARSLTFALLALLLLVSISVAQTERVFQAKGLTTGKPGKNVYPDTSPGETTVIERSYAGAPPLIPHNVDGLATTRTSNDCLGCHFEGTDFGVGHRSTKVPASHFMNAYTGEKKSATVIGIRYNCSQCHVPQSTEAPPVAQKK
ncbi:MAG: nitrate reductase cytochrome c-type subunit [Acidobacteria bacterium]|nr:nitrate reductase cytochrome c-type subunit [Acidobacteriota bacterium]MBI3658345.1 nitrate reductase cytochrome c-type subunit [Acidobacteriota bacterium]